MQIKDKLPVKVPKSHIQHSNKQNGETKAAPFPVGISADSRTISKKVCSSNRLLREKMDVQFGQMKEILEQVIAKNKDLESENKSIRKDTTRLRQEVKTCIKWLSEMIGMEEAMNGLSEKRSTL
ncbi:unnamed protein product [Agarophyton chilense]